jgi:hypothetical protein
MAHDNKTELAHFCDGIRDPAGKLYHYTHREKLFVFHYLTDDRHVAVNAVREAGYGCTTYGSTRQMASEILRRPKIQAAINKAFESLVMPKMELLHRLSKVAGGSVEDVLNENDEFDMAYARKAGTAFLLKKVKIERDVVEVKSETVGVLPGDEGEGEPEIFERSIIKEKVTFEIHDPLRAIEMLGKHARLFNENIQHLNRDGEPADQPAAVVIHLPDNGRGDATLSKKKPARTRGRSETQTDEPGPGNEPENFGNDPSPE